jgi:hypothetical protein
MAVIRRSRFARLAVACLLVAGFAVGTSAYESRFDACFVGEEVCGPGCSIGAFGCNFCEEVPFECAIEFDTCSVIVCDGPCPFECVIIET